MKKSVVMTALASVLLLIFANPVFAARPDQQPYNSPALGQGDLIGLCTSGDPADPDSPFHSCAVSDPLPGEQKVTVTINDNGPTPDNVYASVGQDILGDGTIRFIETFCTGPYQYPSDREVSLRVTPSGDPAPVVVFVWATPGVDPLCPGAGTNGTVDFLYT